MTLGSGPVQVVPKAVADHYAAASFGALAISVVPEPEKPGVVEVPSHMDAMTLADGVRWVAGNHAVVGDGLPTHEEPSSGVFMGLAEAAYPERGGDAVVLAPRAVRRLTGHVDHEVAGTQARGELLPPAQAGDGWRRVLQVGLTPHGPVHKRQDAVPLTGRSTVLGRDHGDIRVEVEGGHAAHSTEGPKRNTPAKAGAGKGA